MNGYHVVSREVSMWDAEKLAETIRRRGKTVKVTPGFTVEHGRRSRWYVVWERNEAGVSIPKTKKFNGKVYELLTERNPRSKASAEFTVKSWRGRGRGRGARMVKVEGGYVVYLRGG